MRRQWRLRVQGVELRLIRYLEATPEERRTTIPPPTMCRLVRSWLATVEVTGRKNFLRSLLAESAGSYPQPRADLAGSLAAVDRLIRQGRFIGVPVQLPVGYGILKEGAEPANLAPVEPVREERPELTWVEIELLDPQGEPIPNEAYALTLPDGVIRTGRLNSRGTARVEGIPAGTCQVQFPGIDGREWSPA